ncbi:hypothetical protein, partial [Roseiarcus sp.]|uniref:hypothetical protein n=1 Tax=Roseiarcus sp. TaxID=1969460 RepID=UPI003C673932
MPFGIDAYLFLAAALGFAFAVLPVVGFLAGAAVALAGALFAAALLAGALAGAAFFAAALAGALR